jgi:hypothetical protein
MAVRFLLVVPSISYACVSCGATIPTSECGLKSSFKFHLIRVAHTAKCPPIHTWASRHRSLFGGEPTGCALASWGRSG